MAEITRIKWKIIPGTYGLYEVSNFGDIRDRVTNKLLKISCNSKGYAIVNLNKKLYKVHKLVGECFLVKPQTEIPLQIDHIDRNRMNNNSKNLRWVSASENRKNQKKRAKYNRLTGKKIKRICIATGEEFIFQTLTEAAKSVNMGISTIRERLQTGRPTKSGFKFIYVDGEKKQ